jgi:uncharacterized membrane protein
MKIILSSVSRKLSEIYNAIVNSIAFYPALISCIYIMLVILLVYFDYTPLAQSIKSTSVLFIFKETETAQTILTTLITGIMSLMALSFSMVMVVLSQATNNISPKVMQGLIAEKEPQFVLGNQLGTVVYCLILLLLLRQEQLSYIPSFSILFSVLIGILSMILFVYFIHNIARSIQITNIVKDIHDTTLKVLAKVGKQDRYKADVDTSAFKSLPHDFPTDKPGFMQEINTKRIVKLASKHNMVIRIHGFLTDYVVSGRTLFHANIATEELPESTKKQIYNSIIFYHNENVKRNYVYGFTQLSEVAVKALSPGINDPGIACLCIQYLSNMFLSLYNLNEQSAFVDKDGEVRLIVNRIPFKDLLNMCITPIRQYGSKDIKVVRALLGLIAVVAVRDKAEKKYRHVLNEQAKAILSGIKEHLSNINDADAINSMVEKMEHMVDGYFQIERLQLVD